jgi:hypothetical protein
MLTSSSNLGSTATTVLPFQVEPKIVMYQPNLEANTCSVNLYVVLKKTFKMKDKLVTSIMTLQVSKGIKKSSTSHTSNFQ